MPDAQRVVLLGLTFGIIVVLLGLAETWMFAGPSLLRTWAPRVPEAVAVMVAATVLAVVALPGIGAQGGMYLVLAASAVALYRVRLPEARRALTPVRAAMLLVGAVGAMLFLGLLFGALAGQAPA